MFYHHAPKLKDVKSFLVKLILNKDSLSNPKIFVQWGYIIILGVYEAKHKVNDIYFITDGDGKFKKVTQKFTNTS